MRVLLLPALNAGMKRGYANTVGAILQKGKRGGRLMDYADHLIDMLFNENHRCDFCDEWGESANA